MSPRAAWQLERLGFGEVYDYAAGKAAWLAMGRSAEGSIGDEERAGPVARRDAPTCGPDETVADARARLGEWELAVVVTDGVSDGASGGVAGGVAGGVPGGVVLGVLTAAKAAESPAGERVGDVMAAGPSTFRPSITRTELAAWMDNQDGSRSRRTLITTLDGRLVGVVCREDL